MVALKVEGLEEIPEKNLLHIQATVFVERDSQKAIIIGKGGQMPKKMIKALNSSKLAHQNL